MNERIDTTGLKCEVAVLQSCTKNMAMKINTIQGKLLMTTTARKREHTRLSIEVKKNAKYLGGASTGSFRTASSRPPVAQAPLLGPCSTCQFEPRETTHSPHLTRQISTGRQEQYWKSYVMLIPTFPFHSRLRTIHVDGMLQWNAAHADLRQSRVTTSHDVVDWLTADALVMTRRSDSEVWRLVLGISRLTSYQ